MANSVKPCSQCEKYKAEIVKLKSKLEIARKVIKQMRKEGLFFVKHDLQKGVNDETTGYTHR